MSRTIAVRRSPARSAQTRDIEAAAAYATGARDARAQAQEAAEAAQAALVEGLLTRYYSANALAAMGNRHSSGACHGLRSALSLVTGINEITLGYQLDHTILPGTGAWCHVQPIPGEGDVLIHVEDGQRTRVEDRLFTLRHQALLATGHPLAAYFAEHHATS